MTASEHIAILTESIRRADSRAASLLDGADLNKLLDANAQALAEFYSHEADNKRIITPHSDAARRFAKNTALHLDAHGDHTIDEDFLRKLAGRLVNHDIPCEGLYRRYDMFVYQTEKGIDTIAYVAAPGEDVEREMEEFFKKYADIPTVYKACCLPMDFMGIHPFPDMNGRTSRMLFAAALRSLGFRAAYYLPLEEAIDMDGKRYMQVLAASNGRSYDAPKNYDVWVRYLLDRTALAYALLDARLRTAGMQAKTNL